MEHKHWSKKRKQVWLSEVSFNNTVSANLQPPGLTILVHIAQMVLKAAVTHMAATHMAVTHMAATHMAVTHMATTHMATTHSV